MVEHALGYIPVSDYELVNKPIILDEPSYGQGDVHLLYSQDIMVVIRDPKQMFKPTHRCQLRIDQNYHYHPVTNEFLNHGYVRWALYKLMDRIPITLGGTTMNINERPGEGFGEWDRVKQQCLEFIKKCETTAAEQNND